MFRQVKQGIGGATHLFRWEFRVHAVRNRLKAELQAGNLPFSHASRISRFQRHPMVRGTHRPWPPCHWRKAVNAGVWGRAPRIPPGEGRPRYMPSTGSAALSGASCREIAGTPRPGSLWLHVRENLDSCFRRNDKDGRASPFLHACVENPPYDLHFLRIPLRPVRLRAEPALSDSRIGQALCGGKIVVGRR